VLRREGFLSWRQQANSRVAPAPDNRSGPLFLRHLMAGIRHHDAEWRLTEEPSVCCIYPTDHPSVPEMHAVRSES
jgi:hypothetical protein